MGEERNVYKVLTEKHFDGNMGSEWILGILAGVV
jgi:hypothetical protein